MSERRRAPLASIATEIAMNHSSSFVPVNEVSRETLSGFVRSASGVVVKFQRVRAAYVAHGGRPRWDEISRKGLEMQGGRI
jgi:hypothetical protein